MARQFPWAPTLIPVEFRVKFGVGALKQSVPAARTILPMTTTPSVWFWLELHSDGERIDGRLRDQRGNDWPFSSWLGLLTLIEQLRASTSSVTNEPTQPEVF